MVKRYRNGWWLELKYWEEGLTQSEIAEECGVSPRTIRKYMERNGIETRTISGENHPLYGQERDKETKREISHTLSGRELSEEWRENIAEGLRGRSIPSETRAKIADALRGRIRSMATRERMSESTAGEQNPNWRGGYSRYYGTGWGPARKKARDPDEVCQECGHDGTKNSLEVHHIVPVREFKESPELTRSDAHKLENLVLLCNSCHTKADLGSLAFETGLEKEDLPEQI